jgi:hypothetical protein
MSFFGIFLQAHLAGIIDECVHLTLTNNVGASAAILETSTVRKICREIKSHGHFSDNDQVSCYFLLYITSWQCNYYKHLNRVSGAQLYKLDDWSFW